MFPIKPFSYDRGYELEWMSHAWESGVHGINLQTENLR